MRKDFYGTACYGGLDHTHYRTFQVVDNDELYFECGTDLSQTHNCCDDGRDAVAVAVEVVVIMLEKEEGKNTARD